MLTLVTSNGIWLTFPLKIVNSLPDVVSGPLGRLFVFSLVARLCKTGV